MKIPLLESRVAVLAYVFTGFLLNNLFHVYRFAKNDWPLVTGIYGQPQPVGLSYAMALWPLPFVLFSSKLSTLIAHRRLRLRFLGPAVILLDQISGRSVLKGLLDAILWFIFYAFILFERVYGVRGKRPRSTEDAELIHSELLNIFQTSVVVVTFVITTFGFDLASDYLKNYFQTDIAQPTMWWFSVMTVYLTLGIVFFLSLRSLMLATRIRRFASEPKEPKSGS